MDLNVQIQNHITDLDKLLAGRGADERAVVLLQAKSTALLAAATYMNGVADYEDDKLFLNPHDHTRTIL